MINNKNNKPFLAVPFDMMNPKHPLHKKLYKELVNFKTNLELKVFIAVLAEATMILKTTKKQGKQTFSTVGFLGDNSFLPGTLVEKKLEKIINEMNTPFFDSLSFSNKIVEFKLSDLYMKSALKRQFIKIDLMRLKSLTSPNTTKLVILQSLYPFSEKNPKRFIYLNFLLEVFNISKKMTRKDQIRAVKDVFRSLEKLELLNWEYIYPKKANDDKTLKAYSFIYSAFTPEIKEDNEITEEVKPEIKENSINIKEDTETLKENIDEKFSIEDFDLDELLEDHSIRNSAIGHTEYLKHVEK